MSVRGIIPAYAGSTFRGSGGNVPYADHPRIRGEHKNCPYDAKIDQGSSPHTRGAPTIAGVGVGLVRIIPAYAGSTDSSIVSHFSFPDHPRIRGEHRVEPDQAVRAAGSSPHTRGAPRRRAAQSQGKRIIPAYAGSTLGNPCNTKDRRRDYTSFPLPVTHPSGGGGS